MPRILNSRWRLAIGALVCAVVFAIIAVGVIVHRRNVRLHETTFRIGFFNTPLEHFRGPDGKPTGDSVDLINEAARRAGIKLDWVYSPEGGDAALQSGQVDLWPALGDLPERKGHLYITAPWNIYQYGMVSRNSNPIPWGDTSHDLTLAVTSGTTEEIISRRSFPNAKFLAAGRSATNLLNALCTGKAQAAVIVENFSESTLPEACQNVPLHMTDEPNYSVRFGVAASYHQPDAVEAADLLRNQLGAMAEDGSLVDSEFHWLDPSLLQTRAMFYMLAVERSERLLFTGAILLGAILVLLGWLITERRRTADSLTVERKLLRTLIDTMPDYIFVKDAEGRFVVVNRALAKLIGVSKPEDMLGKTDFDYFQKETAWSFHSDEQAIIKSGEALLHQEITRADAQGNERWIWTSKVPWRDKFGQVIGIMGNGHDITELKRAEEKFHKAFNASPEPITITTISEGRYMDVNESFLRTTGHRREDVIGHTSSELKFWERPEDRTKLVSMLREEGSVRDLEIPFLTKSGERRIGLHSVDRIEFAGQECMISSKKDITNQQVLEKQLRQAQKMEAVGRLSGGIAHDFNNLLGVIIGYSEVLEDSLDQDSKLCRNAREIKKAGQRAASLTRQLLAFSRQQVLEPKVLNLNDVVIETEKMLRRLIGEDINLTTNLASDLGRVRADQVQIEQVILNLAVNARDAMPDGGKLVMETRNVKLDDGYSLSHQPTVPGEYVALVISDSGEGMDMQTQAHIFEPFFTTKEPGKGTGLGLATVYGVVKQSGGYIWVYSEPGIGTTFKVYLPRVDQPVEQHSSSHTVGSASGRRSETILLVEDEDSLRMLTRALLEQGGYTVLDASGGDEALEIARHHREHIDLLLTDVIMPGMRGPEVAKSLALVHPESQVLYMSGYTSFTGHGMLDPGAILLQKPFTREVLLNKLREVLDLQNQSQAR